MTVNFQKIFFFLIHFSEMQLSNVLTKIDEKYAETSRMIAQNDVRENPIEYHKAQGMNDVYRSAVGRPSGVNIGVASSMLDEYTSVLTTLTEDTEIEKQQGMIIALKYIMALLEEK